LLASEHGARAAALAAHSPPPPTRRLECRVSGLHMHRDLQDLSCQSSSAEGLLLLPIGSCQTGPATRACKKRQVAPVCIIELWQDRNQVIRRLGARSHREQGHSQQPGCLSTGESHGFVGVVRGSRSVDTHSLAGQEGQRARPDAQVRRCKSLCSAINRLSQRQLAGHAIKEHGGCVASAAAPQGFCRCCRDQTDLMLPSLLV